MFWLNQLSFTSLNFFNFFKTDLKKQNSFLEQPSMASIKMPDLTNFLPPITKAAHGNHLPKLSKTQQNFTRSYENIKKLEKGIKQVAFFFAFQLTGFDE
jgi:hypothetical protein